MGSYEATYASNRFAIDLMWNAHWLFPRYCVGMNPYNWTAASSRKNKTTFQMRPNSMLYTTTITTTVTVLRILTHPTKLVQLLLTILSQSLSNPFRAPSTAKRIQTEKKKHTTTNTWRFNTLPASDGTWWIPNHPARKKSAGRTTFK